MRYLVMFCLLMRSVFAFDVSLVEQKKIGRERQEIILACSLNEDELLYKDALNITINSPRYNIERWEIEGKVEEEYIPVFRLYKPILKDDFLVRVFIEGHFDSVDSLVLDISGLLIIEDIRSEYFLKTIVLQNGSQQLAQDERVMSGVLRSCDFLPPAFGGKLFQFLIALILLLLVTMLQTLRVTDLIMWIGFGAWVYFAFILKLNFRFEITALLLIIISLWYLKASNNIRMLIGIICASVVLPLLIEGCILRLL